MLKWRNAVAVLLGAIVYLADNSRGNEEDESARIQSLCSECSKAHADLESAYANVRGSGEFRIEGIGDKNPTVRLFSVEFARKPGNSKYFATGSWVTETTTNIKKQIPDVAVCSTPSASFRVQRKPGDTAFSITHLDDPSAKNQAMPSVVVPFLNAPYTLTGRPLSEHFSNPEFSVTSAEEIWSHNRKMVNFNFHSKSEPKSKSPSARALSDGWVLVSPQEKWAVYQYEAHFRSANGRSSQVFDALAVDYGDAIQGIPIPKLVTYKRIHKSTDGKKVKKTTDGRIVHDGDVTNLQTLRVDHLDFELEPDESFTLASFGLPELEKPKSGFRRGTLTLQLFAVAGASLVVAVMLRYLAWRRHRHTAGTAL